MRSRSSPVAQNRGSTRETSHCLPSHSSVTVQVAVSVERVGADHLVVQVDSLAQPVLVDDLVQVVEDLVGVGDGVVGSPRQNS